MNNSEPTVSIFIPTHDRPVLLREALASVLENGYADFEVVVADDSPNGSAAPEVERLQDSRVRYLRNPNPGTKAGNWECAVRATRGKYLFKLDDDDRILPGFLSRCVAILEQEPDVASVYTGHNILWPDGRIETVIDTRFFALPRRDGWDYLRAVLANEGGYPRTQKTTAVFRREAAQRLGFYSHASEDFAFSAALGLCGAVAYVPAVLYEWRIHSGSGVRDLARTWQLSREACDGLRRLRASVVPEERRDEWTQLIEATERALPWFYLRAAFLDVGRCEGWKFWNEIRRQGAGAWHPLTVAVGLGASVLPRPWLRSLFAWYQHSGTLQKIATRVIVRRR